MSAYGDKTAMKMCTVRAVITGLLVLASVQTWAADVPFLWQVDGPKARHYLLGSVHMLPPSAYPLPDAIEDAYDASQGLVLESDLGALATPEMQGRMLGAARDDRPGGLKAHIGRGLYKKLQSRAAKMGMPTPVCEAFRAWFCALTLELYTMQQAGFQAEYGIDQYFYGLATDDGKPVSWLESPDQQMELFEGLPDALSAQFLDATVEGVTEAGQSPEALLKIWREGDIAALEHQLQELKAHYKDLHARLIANRNHAWIPKLTELLNGEAPQLVVVGAAHYAGADGLLALLKARGLEALPVPVPPAAPDKPEDNIANVAGAARLR